MKAILQYPDPRLLEVSEPVVEINSSVKELGAELVEILERSESIGVAAIQIGSKLRVIAVKFGSENQIIVNPEIIKWSEQECRNYEACSSINHGETLYMIQRHKKVKVKGLNLGGHVSIYKGSGLFAVVLQHEIDHLNGILINSDLKRR